MWSSNLDRSELDVGGGEFTQYWLVVLLLICVFVCVRLCVYSYNLEPCSAVSAALDSAHLTGSI